MQRRFTVSFLHVSNSRWPICEPLSAASSARTTITTHAIVAAGSWGRTFINVIVNSLSRNDVAVAVRPDTVAAVLALFERVFGATLAPIGHAWSFIQRKEWSLFDLGDCFYLRSSLNVDASNCRRGEWSNKSSKEDETHFDEIDGFRCDWNFRVDTLLIETSVNCWGRWSESHSSTGSYILRPVATNANLNKSTAAHCHKPRGRIHPILHQSVQWLMPNS